MIQGRAPASRRESAPISGGSGLEAGGHTAVTLLCALYLASDREAGAAGTSHRTLPSLCPGTGNALIGAGAGKELTRQLPNQRGLNFHAAMRLRTGSGAPTRPWLLLRCTQQPFKGGGFCPPAWEEEDE